MIFTSGFQAVLNSVFAALHAAMLAFGMSSSPSVTAAVMGFHVGVGFCTAVNWWFETRA